MDGNGSSPAATIAERSEADGPRSFEPITCTQPPSDWDASAVPENPTKKDYAIKWNCKMDGSLSVGADLRAYRPKVVAVWMRKGGVAKTTTTFQLGHALAAIGLKTLMVDLDSQQDLTELCFRAVTEAKNETDVQDYLKSKVQFHHGQKCSSLADALRFVLDDGLAPPNGAPPHATTVGLLKPYAFPVESFNSTDGTKTVDNLWLVQGGVNFEKVEESISEQYGSFNTQNPRRNCPGAMFHAIWNAGFDKEADVILLDLSPALAVTNEIAIMHADYFLVPCEINKLSEKNLMSIGPLFESWYKRYQYGGPAGGGRIGYRDVTRGLTNNLNPQRAAELPLPDIAPKFLGIVLSKYDYQQRAEKRDARGNPICVKEMFKSDARRIQAGRLLNAAKLLTKHLTPEHIKDDSFALDPAVFTADGDGLGEFRHPEGSEHHPQPYVLARVAKGNQLYEAAAPVTGKPMSAIDETDMKDLKGLFSGAKNKAVQAVEHYRRVFTDLARFINHLEQPPPYNFVFDVKAAGGQGGPGAHIPKLENIVSRPGGSGPQFGPYPDIDSIAAVDARRSAPVW
eukprot:m.851734 g.851734  ORF g.851734 m.851734 type:complete len:568 (+) comp23493_c0_seq5:292-1995(+)